MFVSIVHLTEVMNDRCSYSRNIEFTNFLIAVIIQFKYNLNSNGYHIEDYNTEVYILTAINFHIQFFNPKKICHLKQARDSQIFLVTSEKPSIRIHISSSKMWLTHL